MLSHATLILPGIGGVRVRLLTSAFADQLTGGIRRISPERSFQPLTPHLWWLRPGTRPDHRLGSII